MLTTLILAITLSTTTGFTVLTEPISGSSKRLSSVAPSEKLSRRRTKSNSDFQSPASTNVSERTTQPSKRPWSMSSTEPPSSRSKSAQYLTFDYQGESTLLGEQLDQSDVEAWATEIESIFHEVDTYIYVPYTHESSVEWMTTNSIPIQFDLHVDYPSHMDTFEIKRLVSLILSAFDSFEKEEEYVLDPEEYNGIIGSDGEVQIELKIHILTDMQNMKGQLSARNIDHASTPTTAGRTVAIFIFCSVFMSLLLIIMFQRIAGRMKINKRRKKYVPREISFEDSTGNRDRTNSEEISIESSVFTMSISADTSSNDSLTEKNTKLPTERFFHAVAPPGNLGIILDTKPSPCGYSLVVHTINCTSPVADQIRVGDRLVKVDGQDCTRMTASQASEVICAKWSEPSRLLYFARKVRE